MVVSEPTSGHTLLDVVLADPTRADLVARAAIVPQHVASVAAQDTTIATLPWETVGMRSFLLPSRLTGHSCRLVAIRSEIFVRALRGHDYHDYYLVS